MSGSSLSGLPAFLIKPAGAFHPVSPVHPC
jgi:hypothetical protein